MKSKFKQENCSIDIIKAICAVLVVLQHIPLYYGSEVYQSNIMYFFTQMLGRTAVPFFYVVSGYYFNKTLLEGKDALRKQGIKIINIYLMWTVLYIPLNLYKYVIEDGWGLLNIIRRYFVDVFLCGTHYQLYYIIALIISMCAATIAYKFGMLKVYAVFSVLLYLFGTLITSYPSVLNDIEIIQNIVSFKYYIFVRRYFFIAPAFFMMGYWILLFEKKAAYGIERYAVLLGSMLLMFAEEIVIVKMGGQNMMGIFIYVFVFELFKFCLRHPFTNKLACAKYARSFSNFSYFVHPIIFSIVSYGLKIDNYIVATIIVFVIIIGLHLFIKKQPLELIKKLC